MFAKDVIQRASTAMVLMGALAVHSPAVAQQVGKAAAVNQDATGAGQVLEIGAPVLHRERIVTNARGTTQLLFIDQTTLSVGPNSDLVIDEYVFDPNRGVGKMTASLSKGVMRFIGGQITHNGSATVNTPPATIGIRGGVVDISTDGTTTQAANSFGTVTFTPTGGGPAVNVPQGSTGANAPGGGATVTPTTQQQASTTNAQFQSKGSQTGGASPGTSQGAAAASSTNTTTTSSITTSSSPAPGSTVPGPSTTTASSTSPSSGSTGAGPSGGSGVTNPNYAPNMYQPGGSGPATTTPSGGGGAGGTTSPQGNTGSAGSPGVPVPGGPGG